MVCPNCGAPLPDTVTMCYSCRTRFNKPNPVNDKSVQSILIEAIEDEKRFMVNVIAVVGLIGVLLEVFATFAPIYKIYTNYDSFTESISDTKTIAIWYWLDVVILLIFSIPGIKYKKNIGGIKLFFGGCGIIGTFRLAVYLRDWFHEQSFKGIIGTVNFSFQAGMYLLFVSFLFTLISGIMLVIYGYDTKSAYKKHNTYNFNGIKNDISINEPDSSERAKNIILGILGIAFAIFCFYMASHYNNSVNP